MSASAMPSAGPGKRGRRIALRIVVVGLVAALGLELTLRALLFGSAPSLRRWGAPLRDEHRYAAIDSLDAWKLRTLFGRRGLHVHQGYDPVVGFRKQDILPDYRHADAERVGERRPVLLYGDSYAACVAEAGPRWEELLEDSELADRFALLNYGVGGYGLDQAILLLEQSLDLYLEDDPLVILSFLVEDDLHRCLLPLRDHPKPFFTLELDDLVLHRAPELSAKDYVRAHPPAITSYALRALLFASGGLSVAEKQAWSGETDRAAEARALARPLLIRAQDFLEERGVAYFFLLFHARGSTRSAEPFGWEEPFVYELLRERAIPFVTSKRFLWADANRTGRSREDYFFPTGPADNHYNADGNRVVLEAFLDGLQGRFEPNETLPEGYLPGVERPRR